MSKSARVVEKFFARDLAALDRKKADLVHAHAAFAGFVGDVEHEPNRETVAVRIGARHLHPMDLVVVAPRLAFGSDRRQAADGSVHARRAPRLDTDGGFRKQLVQTLVELSVLA